MRCGLWKRKNCMMKKASILASHFDQHVFLAFLDPRLRKLSLFSSNDSFCHKTVREIISKHLAGQWRNKIKVMLSSDLKKQKKVASVASQSAHATSCSKATVKYSSMSDIPVFLLPEASELRSDKKQLPPLGSFEETNSLTTTL